MKSAVVLLFALMLAAPDIFAQTLPKKPSRSDVGSYNHANLLKIDIGVSKNKALEVMGGVQKIQTYTSTSAVTKKQDIIINNPVNREFKTDSAGNTVEIVWYYTHMKKAEGDITKNNKLQLFLKKMLLSAWGGIFMKNMQNAKE